jgi:hypothetical protein
MDQVHSASPNPFISFKGFSKTACPIKALSDTACPIIISFNLDLPLHAQAVLFSVQPATNLTGVPTAACPPNYVQSCERHVGPPFLITVGIQKGSRVSHMAHWNSTSHLKNRRTGTESARILATNPNSLALKSSPALQFSSPVLHYFLCVVCFSKPPPSCALGDISLQTNHVPFLLSSDATHLYRRHHPIELRQGLRSLCRSQARLSGLPVRRYAQNGFWPRQGLTEPG